MGEVENAALCPVYGADHTLPISSSEGKIENTFRNPENEVNSTLATSEHEA